MDGLAFLRNLMRLRPMPVVMCSSLTQQGADVALDALALGAIDFVAKPAVDVAHGIKEAAHEIIAKVKMAAHAQVRPLADRTAADVGGSARRRRRAAKAQRTDAVSRPPTESSRSAPRPAAPKPSARCSRSCRRTSPGIVIAQHIPKAFSGPFAAAHERLLGAERVRGAATVSPSWPATPTSPRRSASARRSRRRSLPMPLERRRAREPAPALGRRAVSLGGAERRAAIPSA